MKDSTKRSLVKTLTWRVIASIDIVLIAWLVIGDISVALSIGGIEFFTKLIFYYIHERWWAHVHWGREKHVVKKV